MGDPDSAEREALEDTKRQSLAQVLFKSARLLNEKALARVRAATGLDIRPSHTALFPHIDLSGTRLTELAERVGTTKQAVGQLVSELEAMGVIERVPDPTDGRAKLIRFAHRGGRLWIFAGLNLLGELEEELAQRLGKQQVEQLHTGLLALLDLLEE